MDFKPTSEQQAIIDAALTGEDLVIEAAAGTGKTTTLKQIGNALAPKTGAYLAFNKSVADEAKADPNFPANVKPYTSHGLANGHCRMHPEHRHLMAKFGKNKPGNFRDKRTREPGLVDILNIPFAGFRSQDGEVALKNYQVATLALMMVDRFCNSDADEIQLYHLPKQDGLAPAQLDELRLYVRGFARTAWADIQSPAGRLAFTHNHYRKLWALTRPRIDADFILYDEAQDQQPVMIKVVQDQRQYGTQIIIVGDSAQAIYGWTGAVDAMDKF
jgi:hypothetical protein